MARRRKKNGVAELVLMGAANPAELVLMGAANPARVRHDSLWRQARKLLKGNRNPNRWDGARAILTGQRNRQKPDDERYPLDPPGYAKRVRQLEAEGLTTSDAQGVADAEFAKAKRRGQRNNPDAIEKAADLYQEFHGKSASEVVEMQEADTVRKTYTALGDLVDLTIETPDGKGACIQFTGDGVKVASAPGGKQLYLIGGAQSLDSELEKFGADAGKDFVELGRAVQITYRARKGMNDFRLVDYYHDLGEESGKPPLAFYDRLRQRIYFVGGSYHVEAPGIID